jgi:outer membrane lipoprotein-sorting protein
VHGDTKQFTRRQLAGPNDPPQDLLSIGRGPFPMPIGQKRRQVLAMYDVTLHAPNAGAQAPAHHLTLTPRAAEPNNVPAAGRDDLKKIDIWYDRKTLLPERIRTVDDQGNLTTVQLREPKVNELTGVDLDKRFDTSAPTEPGWQVRIIPLDRPNAPNAPVERP